MSPLHSLSLVLSSLPSTFRAAAAHVRSGPLRQSWRLGDSLTAAFLRELLRRGSEGDIAAAKALVEGAPPAPWPLGKVQAGRVRIPRLAASGDGWELPAGGDIDGQWVKYVGKPLDLDSPQTGWFGRSMGRGGSRKSDQKADVGEKAGQQQANAAEPMVLFFHGGAHVTCSTETHRFLTWRLARACGSTGRRCLAVNYSLAPERPFPHGLQDALSAYMFLLHPPPGASHAPVPPTSIFLAGDSAGGNLCAALLLLLRQHGLPMPGGAILISPWLDLSHSLPSFTLNAPYDVLGAAETTAPLYAPREKWPDELVSPLFAADLSGLPPLLIACGAAEALRDESVAFFLRASHARPAARGGEPWVRLEVYADQLHVFQMFGGGAAKASFASMGRFIAACSAGGDRGPVGFDEGIFRVDNAAPYAFVPVSEAEARRGLLEGWEEERAHVGGGKRDPPRCRDPRALEVMRGLGLPAGEEATDGG
ncbi:Alpha/Beta hydrolase protein [Hyaloraphidium curvatum]|nr:Alpha/Beta hydrolase protein [Hyaloraphidium curvatum]